MCTESFLPQAVIVEEFAVQHQRLLELHSPWRSVGLRFVDRDLDFKTPVARPGTATINATANFKRDRRNMTDSVRR
jgi:hypothetical protein